MVGLNVTRRHRAKARYVDVERTAVGGVSGGGLLAKKVAARGGGRRYQADTTNVYVRRALARCRAPPPGRYGAVLPMAKAARVNARLNIVAVHAIWGQWSPGRSGER